MKARIMHIIYLVTTKKGQQCGVLDYTRQLAKAMQDKDIRVDVEELPSWSLDTLKKIKKKYGKDSSVIFHLQYPSLGMGKSCVPALLPLVFPKNRILITFHEFEQFNPLRKLYFLITSLSETRYIFTSEHERSQFTRFFFWAKKNSIIAPIGNNISVFPYEEKTDDPEPRLVYFGHIAPGKGIEEFLKTVHELRAGNKEFSCAIIGALLEPGSTLSQKVKKRAQEENIECLFNLSSEDVSKELQKSSIAYLPFSEGVSDKRGSALACLKHGLAVITKHSALTPGWWRNTTYHASGCRKATEIIQEIASGKLDRIPNPAALKKALDEREWDAIAYLHIKMYNETA